jgi:hypothetical protein
MFRMIAKWYISRSIDQDVRLSKWMRAWIDRDLELKRYELISLQLQQRLRSDAPRWFATPVNRCTPNPRHWAFVTRLLSSAIRPRRRMAWTFAACSLTTAALIAWVTFLSGTHQVAPSMVATDSQSTIARVDRAFVPVDLRRTMLAWKVSRARLDQLLDRVKELPSGLDISARPRVAFFVEPTRRAGSAAGNALKTIDDGLKSQGKQFSSDVRSAVVFFAYRLPVSAAKLVGVQESTVPSEHPEL